MFKNWLKEYNCGGETMFKLCSNHDQLLLFGFFVAVVSCGAHLRFKEATTGLRLRTIRGPWGSSVAWTGITKGLVQEHKSTKSLSLHGASRLPVPGGDPTHLHQGCRPQWHESNQLQRCGPQAVKGTEPLELVPTIWLWWTKGTQEFSVSALQTLDFKTHTVQVPSRCQGGMNVKQQVLWLLVYHCFAPPQPCFSHSKGDAKQQLVNIWRCSRSRFLRKSLSLAPVAPRIPRYLLEVGAGPVQSLEWWWWWFNEAGEVASPSLNCSSVWFTKKMSRLFILVLSQVPENFSKSTYAGYW